MRMARSRYEGSRYFSQVSAGSRTWPSASTTGALTEVVMGTMISQDRALPHPRRPLSFAEPMNPRRLGVLPRWSFSSRSARAPRWAPPTRRSVTRSRSGRTPPARNAGYACCPRPSRAFPLSASASCARAGRWRAASSGAGAPTRMPWRPPRSRKTPGRRRGPIGSPAARKPRPRPSSAATRARFDSVPGKRAAGPSSSRPSRSVAACTDSRDCRPTSARSYAGLRSSRARRRAA